MRLHKLLEAKLPKLNGLSVMTLDQFVDSEEVDEGVAEGIHSPGATQYSGKPEKYTFSKVQQKNYDMLSSILARNGMKFKHIDARTYPARRSYLAPNRNDPKPFFLTSFIVKSPALEWIKYEGGTAGGGQNHVKINGKKMKLTEFLSLPPKQQDALIQSQQGVEEGQLSEAPFGLGANYKKFEPKDMQDYLGRVKDKDKLKTDKYKMPFVHGSNIEIKNEQGKEYDLDKLRDAITQRPQKLLKQNEKMEHSDGSTSIFFNVGLPALKGLAVNEETGDFVIVDTCPGAGACQTYCYAMKGGYVQWKASSMAQTRVLNFLLNDPEGFKKMMEHELGQAERKYGKKGTKVVVRWHDAGDFFSHEYLDVAYSIADDFPDIDFYAYTKMGDVANAPRPSNFKMNFSQGAKRGQEMKVDIKRTKHSKVVPRELFYDLIAREGSSLIKDSKGRTQFRGPGELEEFKDRLAKKYAIDKDSIITYDKMMSIKDNSEPHWNVIVMPGDGDDSANRADVIGTYLLFH